MRKEIREDVYRRLEKLGELMDACDYGDREWEEYNKEYGLLARSIGVLPGDMYEKLHAVEEYMKNNTCPQCGGAFYKKKRTALRIHCRGCGAKYGLKTKRA